ncbi:hypothetical protein EIN_186150 [Entamoeba invadens IP1]|uniref:hypothetical protein n=1 Tax=Entamoeba invadens IP1 TaxID=370355 RepID=UPI0002C3E5ED|nr:hypothetical protein EIN_186150 [Entamoeba invadens IP1]ELP94198.1 hypothetical protein EIN_186150 [Entamoeba invadens IP1]|eukprot:XP_004260969.1 hypothetical protein EIN_186150 [Entamoeba invadens IP1]
MEGKNEEYLEKLLNDYIKSGWFINEGFVSSIFSILKNKKETLDEFIQKRGFYWKSVECHTEGQLTNLQEVTAQHNTLLKALRGVRRELVFVCDEYGRSLRCVSPQKGLQTKSINPLTDTLVSRGCGNSTMFYCMSGDGVCLSPLIVGDTEYLKEVRLVLGDKVTLLQNENFQFTSSGMCKWIVNVIIKHIKNKRKEFKDNLKAVILFPEYYKNPFTIVPDLKKENIETIGVEKLAQDFTPFDNIGTLLDSIVISRWTDDQKLNVFIAASEFLELDAPLSKSCFEGIYKDDISNEFISNSAFESKVLSGRDLQKRIDPNIVKMWEREGFIYNINKLKSPLNLIVFHIISTQQFMLCKSVKEQILFFLCNYPTLVKFFKSEK